MHRLAKDSDLETVFNIYMAETVVPFLGYDPMPLDEFRPIYEDLLKEQCFFVYEEAGEVAGFYKISRRPGRAHHVAYLGKFAVSPTFHGRGIGRKMLSDVIESMVAEGVKRIELIVESDNTGAVAFYERLGFEIEGTLKKFYKRAHEMHYVDDYIMARIFD